MNSRGYTFVLNQTLIQGVIITKADLLDSELRPAEEASTRIRGFTHGP